MKESYFLIVLYIKKEFPSQAYNGVKVVSMFVVSLIVKFSHKVH